MKNKIVTWFQSTFPQDTYYKNISFKEETGRCRFNQVKKVVRQTKIMCHPTGGNK